MFMNKATEKRWNSPRFDCELPPEVRAELVSPRRPRILQVIRRDRPRQPWFFIALALAIPLALIIAADFSILRRPSTAVPTPVLPTPIPTPAPVPTSKADISEPPLLVSSPNDERFFRSEVVRSGRSVRMPYGEAVRIIVLGTLPDQESLPLTGNHIGDTYHVGDAEFVWVAPEGIGQWIDP
jgi:hypothetical protein